MSSMQIFEANLGTRNEAEAAALVLEGARKHLLNNPELPLVEACSDLQAMILLASLSELIFPDYTLKIRRGAL